ncbi:MAG: TetR/AcrR family transcriptional regulator [Treponema sp.]|nr:TetR/AcrR family transcriptional regulator [Treponema sp.]
MKKTTVDELVKRTGIPKGTFYLFYPSKEILLFDISQENIDLTKT